MDIKKATLLVIAGMDEYEEYQRKKDEEQLRLLNELDEIPFVDKVK